MPDGSEEPIAFASNTVRKTERGYRQVEKESLSVIYGVRHFYQYLSGRRALYRYNRPQTTADDIGPDN